jgi:hypothetical protein
MTKYGSLFAKRFLPAISGYETEELLSRYLARAQSVSSSMFNAGDLVALSMRLLQHGLDDRKALLEAGFLERARPYVEAAGTKEEKEMFQRLTAPRDLRLAIDIVARWPSSTALFPVVKEAPADTLWRSVEPRI